MKRLTLIRHAQAEAALADQSDFDRVLTRRGNKDAAEMARRLKQRRLHPDFLVLSPAARTRATADVFIQTLKIPVNSTDADDRLYAADAKEFMSVVRETDDAHKHLIVVAHNPGIAEFADRLSEERRVSSMTTCTIVTMEIDIANWK